MIIVMEEKAKKGTVEDVVKRVKREGFDVQLNKGTERVVIAVLGSDTHKLDTQPFLRLPGVVDVYRIQKPYKLASRGFKRENSVIDVGGGVKVGGKEIIIMAGPCSVENREQVMACAEVVKDHGGKILRGGAFKPRTSPYSFQGLEKEGLGFLREAADKTGLLVITEATSPSNVDMVAEYADIIQIGARNMQNYELLKACAKTGKPVLLKRGLAAGIEDEWLPAADYILNGNNSLSVILCERGIKTFEKTTRYTLDISAIPVVKKNSHLPIIVDPSHAPGYFEYVPSLAKAAIAAGADGLIIEMHPDPPKALSDGAQSLTFSDFERLMKELCLVVKAVGRKI